MMTFEGADEALTTATEEKAYKNVAELEAVEIIEHLEDLVH